MFRLEMVVPFKYEINMNYLNLNVLRRISDVSEMEVKILQGGLKLTWQGKSSPSGHK